MPVFAMKDFSASVTDLDYESLMHLGGKFLVLSVVFIES